MKRKGKRRLPGGPSVDEWDYADSDSAPYSGNTAGETPKRLREGVSAKRLTTFGPRMVRFDVVAIPSDLLKKGERLLGSSDPPMGFW